MQNVSLIVLSALAFAGSPLVAQVLAPSARDLPSEATIAVCTSQVAIRWSQMTPAEQAQQTREEMITTCAINTEIASYAKDQHSEFLAARKARADKIALQNAKYQSEMAAWEARVKQQKDHYAAAYAQWEADVAACKAGELSKCMPR